MRQNVHIHEGIQTANASWGPILFVPRVHWISHFPQLFPPNFERGVVAYNSKIVNIHWSFHTKLNSQVFI